MRVHLVNPSDVAFGVGVITPRCSGVRDRKGAAVRWSIRRLHRSTVKRQVASHVSAAVSRHDGSSLSMVLAGILYRWINKALSTLRHHFRLFRRRIDVVGWKTAKPFPRVSPHHLRIPSPHHRTNQPDSHRS